MRYQVTFDRRYRQGEEWESASSFGKEDLLVLGKIANEAHSWITGRKRQARVTANQPVLTKVRRTPVQSGKGPKEASDHAKP